MWNGRSGRGVKCGRARAERGGTTALLLATLLLGACEEPTLPPASEARPAEIVDATPVLGSIGEPVGVSVRVLTEAGEPLEGAGVRFEPPPGHGSVAPSTGVTDADGAAATTWTLGQQAGDQRVQAWVVGFDEVSLAVHGLAFVPPDGFVGVSVGAGAFTCGVAADGRAFCWGADADGRLGLGPHGQRATPGPVASEERFVLVDAGRAHACGIADTGAAHCWGANGEGMLGDGSGEDSAVPVPVAGGLDFPIVTAGESHSCGLTSEGVAHCWGSGDGGRLGSGAEIQASSPVPVAGNTRYTDISAGGAHTCAVAEGGHIHCWGSGGPWLGTGDGEPRLTPAPVDSGELFLEVSAGDRHACGLTLDAEIHCWGEGLDGRLGTGGSGSEPRPARVTGGLSFVDVSAGRDFTCALSTDAAAYCWGDGSRGQLGDGESGEEHDAPSPVAVEGEHRFVVISAAGSADEGGHACGVDESGDVWCWGAGDRGQLGTGTAAVGYVQPEPARVWEPEGP